MNRGKSPNRRPRKMELAVSAVVEELERRRLLSSSLSGTVLTINTGSVNDIVTVTEPAGSGNLIVTENGVQTTYPAANVETINGIAGSGAVSIKLDETVTQDATLVGGSGNDTLWGGAGDDSITGGSGVVNGGSGFSLAQPNAAVTFNNVDSFYDLPPDNSARTVSAPATVVRAAASAATVSFSGLFIGKSDGTSDQLTLHLLKGSTNHFAGTLYEGTTVYQVRAQLNPPSSSTTVLGTFTQDKKEKHFTASVSGSEMALALPGANITLKKYHSMADAAIDGTALVVQGSSMNEQINVSQSASKGIAEFTVTASSGHVTQQLGTFSAVGLGPPQGEDTSRRYPWVEVIAGSGNDTLSLNAADGSDPVILFSELDAGSGSDVLEGEVGSKSNTASVDFVSGTGDDTLKGGDGPTNIADYTNHSEAVSVSLQDGLASKGTTGQYDVLERIDSVIGGSGDDTLEGGSGQSNLLAGLGQDFLEGGSGTTALQAANANRNKEYLDTLDGGSGPTAFYMADGLQEDYENYNPAIDLTFSGDQNIDYDLTTQTYLGS